jgi:hypothetical protein
VPIAQDLTNSCPWEFWCIALVMFSLISVSLYFALNLMWPVNISYLEISKNYHEDLRQQYEGKILKSGMTKDETKNAHDSISQLLKASYIDELNKAQINNRDAFVRKNGYYFRALVWALSAVLPYIICIGFHLSKKEDKVQKVEIVNEKKNVNCITK